MDQLPAALLSMASYAQFVLYKIVPSKKRPGKTDKYPVSLMTGEVCDGQDPKNWGTIDQALMMQKAFGDGYGIGFMITRDDPFYFLDIDGAATGNNWSPIAVDIMTRLQGAAIEVSNSGTGLHIFGRYTGTEPPHACKNVPLNLELYTSGRLAALTGNQAMGDANTVQDAQLAAVIAHYFPLDTGTDDDAADFIWTHEPVAESNPIQDDDKLIEAALESKSATGAFGKSAPFRALWERDVETLARCFPDNAGDRPFDESSADASLASHLRFWTGGNCDRMERLMRRSALKRPKWDEHKSYMRRTFKKAFSGGGGYYNKGAPIEVADYTEATIYDPIIKEGYQLMPPTQQIDFFKGCVYVSSTNSIFDANKGRMLKQDQFNVMYGGHSFMIDHDGNVTTKKAWDAFTQSQSLVFPKADEHCFDPRHPTGHIIEREGYRYVNTFVPVDIPMAQGDVSKFLAHVEKLLPNPRDREILLSYMSSCIRYAGYKIQWTVLIQGAQGNGKTLLTRCVAYALGKRYTHWPKAAKIDSQFNQWLVNKLLIAVEDIHVPAHRNEILETLKPMITGGDGLEIEGKGVDQVSRDICANFMINSNHKDAIKVTRDDRRYCIFYTAQQSKEDIARDGMTEDYMSDLYDWLKGENKYEGQTPGYAIVAHYLKYEFPIPAEFNPTGACQRAPETSSTDEAIEIGMGVIEQEVLEAINEGRPGFNGGWVSSKALDTLLNDMRRGGMIPRNKRRDLMQRLGYDYHPGLKNGRVNSTLPAEGAKPHLYIARGHIHQNLTYHSEIVRLYCAAQGYGDVFGVDGSVNRA